MRILYVITQADGGGAQNYTLALAKHFNGAIAAGDEASMLFDAAKNLQLTTYRLKHLKRAVNPWHDFWATWEIRQLIKSLKPDIVHLNSSKAGILGSFAAIGLKTKVVFTAHGFVFNEPLPRWLKTFYLALEKTASAYRNYIICVSEADRRAALKNNLIADDKISVIHNGIEKINFLPRAEARQKLGLPMDKMLIGTIANDYPSKGLDTLEQATALMTTSDTKVVVIGKTDKPLTAGSDTKFRRHGYLADAAIYLKAFDVINIPSRKEGFPFVILEAMQAGLPIVATEVGGNQEALGDAGIIIAPNDPKALSEADDLLLNNQAKRLELSQKVLERTKLFTEEKMLAATQKNYESLLD